MICPCCRTKNPSDSIFCVSCGANLKKKENNKSVLIVLIMVCVICVASTTSTIFFSVIFSQNLNDYYILESEYQELEKNYNNWAERYKQLSIEKKAYEDAFNNEISRQYGDYYDRDKVI